MAQEMPIFTRTFDLLSWLLPMTNNFPKAHRFTYTQRLLNAAFDLREYLEEANIRRGRARLERLDRADEALSKLRMYLRLGFRWGWLEPTRISTRTEKNTDFIKIVRVPFGLWGSSQKVAVVPVE